eukprot:gene8661-1549_t
MLSTRPAASAAARVSQGIDFFVDRPWSELPSPGPTPLPLVPESFTVFMQALTLRGANPYQLTAGAQVLRVALRSLSTRIASGQAAQCLSDTALSLPGRQLYVYTLDNELASGVDAHLQESCPADPAGTFAIPASAVLRWLFTRLFFPLTSASACRAVQLEAQAPGSATPVLVQAFTLLPPRALHKLPPTPATVYRAADPTHPGPYPQPGVRVVIPQPCMATAKPPVSAAHPGSCLTIIHTDKARWISPYSAYTDDEWMLMPHSQLVTCGNLATEALAYLAPAGLGSFCGAIQLASEQWLQANPPLGAPCSLLFAKHKTECMSRISQRCPRDLVYLGGLLDCVFQDYQGARECYSVRLPAALFSEDDSRTHNLMGHLLADHFDDDGAALHHFKASLSLDPTNADSHRGLAGLLESGSSPRPLSAHCHNLAALHIEQEAAFVQKHMFTHHFFDQLRKEECRIFPLRATIAGTHFELEMQDPAQALPGDAGVTDLDTDDALQSDPNRRRAMWLL